jgi:hypothetical protein
MHQFKQTMIEIRSFEAKRILLIPFDKGKLALCKYYTGSKQLKTFKTGWLLKSL